MECKRTVESNNDEKSKNMNKTTKWWRVNKKEYEKKKRGKERNDEKASKKKWISKEQEQIRDTKPSDTRSKSWVAEIYCLAINTHRFTQPHENI